MFYIFGPPCSNRHLIHLLGHVDRVSFVGQHHVEHGLLLLFLLTARQFVFVSRSNIFSHRTPMLNLNLVDSFSVQLSDWIFAEVENGRVQILRFGNQNSERSLN